MMAELFLRQGRFADAETLLATRSGPRTRATPARATPWPTPCSVSRRPPAALAHLEVLLAREPARPRLPQSDGRLPRPDRRDRALGRGLRGPGRRRAGPGQDLAQPRPRPARRGPAGARPSPPIAAASPSRPRSGEPYWSLANLKTAAFSPEEEAAMAALLERDDLGDRRPAPPQLRARQGAGGPARLCGTPSRHYARGAALRASAYDPAAADRLVARSKALFTARGPRPRGRRRGLGRADLHRRPAAVGLDPDRADPRQPLRGRRHHGAARDPLHRRSGAVRPIPTPASSLDAPRPAQARRGLSSSARGSTARPTARASSTRCRTTSSTSA